MPSAASTWTSTTAKSLPSWANRLRQSVFTKSFMGLLDANGSITSGTIDYYGADDGKPIRLSDLKKRRTG